MRLSLPGPLCKLSASLPRRAGSRLRLQSSLVSAAVASAFLTGCTAGTLPGVRVVSLADLEASPARCATDTRQCFIRDPAELESLVHPLGRRLGLLEVRSPEQWRQFAQAVPDVGPCPDFNRGIIVGLVSLAGQPLGGGPPFRLRAIRVHDGAGLVEAQFSSGTYLPDGSAYLETLYVKGLRAVLVVNVNGIEYVAEESSRKPTPARTSIMR